MTAAPDLLGKLISGSISLLVVEPDGAMSTRPPVDAVILAGSFNPLHPGHERLLGAAARVTGRTPFYELSITNVDKPPIQEEEVTRRLRQFRGKAAIALTRAPTFTEKSALAPGTVFAIGFDTATRLFPERYYPRYRPAEDPTHAGSAVALAMDTLRHNRCSFLVAGRLGRDGKFHTVAEIEVPPRYRDLLAGLPESDFRADVSSTDLRERGAGLT